jgi:hypothetical protein
MKKVIHISLIALFTLGVASCQKDELDRLGVAPAKEELNERIADDDPTQSEHNAKLKRQKIKTDEIDISVKEVSDGDEESDDDEVTSN